MFVYPLNLLIAKKGNRTSYLDISLFHTNLKVEGYVMMYKKLITSYDLYLYLGWINSCAIRLFLSLSGKPYPMTIQFKENDKNMLCYSLQFAHNKWICTLINWFLLEIIEQIGNNTKAYRNILDWKRAPLRKKKREKSYNA